MTQQETLTKSHIKINWDKFMPYKKSKLSMNEVCNFNTDKRIKSLKTEAMNSLKNYLKSNNLTLIGTVLQVTSHNISEEILCECAERGIITTPFSTTKITFNNDLNELLYKILPDFVTLKKKKSSQDTYIIAEDDDYGFLEEKLRKIYQEPIRVIFDKV